MKNKTINVLGTEYVVIFGNEENFDYLKNNDGYCDYSDKTIVVSDFENAEGEVCENIPVIQNKVLRHEIGHAFMYESGITGVSDLTEEQIVEWVAIQAPKMFKIFGELGILDD